MNVENILKVASAIENRAVPDLGFNMVSWFAGDKTRYPDKSQHKCGTTACVAGWASAVELGPKAFADLMSKTAADKLIGLSLPTDPYEFLGLDQDGLGNELFYGNYDAGPDQAVRTLRHLAATGEVDWSIPLPEGE